MARHSPSDVVVHAAWSTFKRASVLRPVLDERLVGIFRDEAAKQRSVVIATGIAHDHVHVLVGLATTTSIASLVNAMKGVSSRFVEMRIDGRKWGWQRGYWVESIAAADIEPLKHYLRRQRERHDDSHWAERWMQEEE